MAERHESRGNTLLQRLAAYETTLLQKLAIGLGAIALGFGIGYPISEKMQDGHRSTTPVNTALLEAIHSARRDVFSENDSCFQGLPEVKFNRQLLLAYNNLVRGADGEPPFVINPILNHTARVTAEYLAAHYKQKLQHPDTKQAGLDLVDKEAYIHQKGWVKIGENLAFSGTNNMAGDTRCLIESKDHYDNITDSEFNSIGFGDAVAPNGEEYLVVHFAG